MEMRYCGPNRQRERHRVNLPVDQDLWDRFSPVLKKQWGGSFTSWVEFAMECYSRDRCEGCPYNREGFPKSKGIGKRDLKS
jgi:hypothetical protein